MSVSEKAMERIDALRRNGHRWQAVKAAEEERARFWREIEKATRAAPTA